ncbi:MAG: hypothetical protein NC489_34655 [Ruminococcus flavefaciens]|nr:hypothetical protein [Ruminococcus flavefaciens]
MSTKVLLENNMVTFAEEPEYKWTIPDVYLACEALHSAEENNFSFYTVSNKEGIPQLFVSKAFKQCRLLVNALTFRTVLVTKPNLVRRISVMIDMKYSNFYCMNLFDVISELENGASNYLDAIIVGRDTDDETMIVNPITTLYSDDNIYYAREMVEEYRTILSKSGEETEYVELADDMIRRKNVENFTPISTAHAKNMVELYDKLLAKKCNYVDLVGDDYETHFYVSTNWRYLVSATTFECVVVTNINIKKLLQSYVAQSTTPVSDLTLCWMTARTEPK